MSVSLTSTVNTFNAMAYAFVLEPANAYRLLIRCTANSYFDPFS